MTVDSISRKHLAGVADQGNEAAGRAAVLSRDELRDVAEEVRRAFPRPLRAPQLVLIDVDPHRLHAFWTVTAEAVERVRQELGESGRDAGMILRLTEREGESRDGASFDVDVVGLQGRSYVDIWGEARRYSGYLGLRRADGRLHQLAGPALVELPRLGPVDEQPQPTAAHDADAPASAPVPAPAPAKSPTVIVEWVNSPAGPADFPQPPNQPGSFDPLGPTSGSGGPASAAAPAPAGEAVQQTEAAAPAPAEQAPTGGERPSPGPAATAQPANDFGRSEAEELIGGFLPLEAPDRNVPAAEDAGGGAQEGVPAEPQQQQEAPDRAEALPLENVLTLSSFALSSFALGREPVDLEINAELHVFGRARPGTRLQLFGRPVALRPDGTFSIIRPLPSGALVLSSLLIDDTERS